MRIALVGAGRVARALVLALDRAGLPVVAVGSRQPERLSPASYPQPCTPQQAVDQADLVLLTVADDAIAPVAAALRWRAGQAVVHCSGATEVAALAPAAQAGDPAAASATAAAGSHTVRRGESAWTIARRYGLRPAELLTRNGLAPSAVLQPGMVLKLDTDASRK